MEKKSITNTVTKEVYQAQGDLCSRIGDRIFGVVTAGYKDSAGDAEVYIKQYIDSSFGEEIVESVRVVEQGECGELPLLIEIKTNTPLTDRETSMLCWHLRFTMQDGWRHCIYVYWDVVGDLEDKQGTVAHNEPQILDQMDRVAKYITTIADIDNHLLKNSYDVSTGDLIMNTYEDLVKHYSELIYNYLETQIHEKEDD